jgi:hypothetical protein
MIYTVMPMQGGSLKKLKLHLPMKLSFLFGVIEKFISWRKSKMVQIGASGKSCTLEQWSERD